MNMDPYEKEKIILKKFAEEMAVIQKEYQIGMTNEIENALGSMGKQPLFMKVDYVLYVLTWDDFKQFVYTPPGGELASQKVVDVYRNAWDKHWEIRNASENIMREKLKKDRADLFYERLKYIEEHKRAM